MQYEFSHVKALTILRPNVHMDHLKSEGSLPSPGGLSEERKFKLCFCVRKCKVCSIIVSKSSQSFSCHYSVPIYVNGIIPYINGNDDSRNQGQIMFLLKVNVTLEAQMKCDSYECKNISSLILSSCMTKMNVKAKVHLL